MNIPIYLYCTKAKPYLGKEVHGKYACYVRDYGSLNGSVCFKCECEEAFKYDFVHRSGDSSNFYIRDQRTERMKDCLSNDDLFDYGKGKDLFALRLEKVEAIECMTTSNFYKDEDCTEPLTKAPQSYCHAYRKKEKTIAFDGYSKHDKSDFVEKVIIISVRPKWLCKIANGEKDLEVRKTCPKEIKVK